MELPPGPRAPAAWQTVAWATRPAASCGGYMTASATRSRSAPAGPTSRWCCSRTPTPCASCSGSIRRSRRPAGGWEFLRPFSGPHSILVLDGEEHLRERRLIQTPFHGDRMRAFRPAVAALARAELGTWSGRVATLERMRRLTLEVILRVVFGARGEPEAALGSAGRG